MVVGQVEDTRLHWLKSLGSGLGWLWRLPCPLCQRLSSTCFCQDCTDQLHAVRYQPWCSSTGSLKLYTWGLHQGALRQAIHQLKYAQQPRIAQQLGEWMGESWREDPDPSRYTLVPIPLHAKRMQERGYNQAELISQAMSVVTGLDHQPHALDRIRATQAQHSLTIAERQQNLAAAFRVTKRPRFPVLLVDDIYTTGSTVEAACQALQTAQVKVAGVIVASRPIVTSQPQRPILKHKPRLLVDQNNLFI